MKNYNFQLWISFLFIIISTNFSFGQAISKSSNIWYFGDRAGLDFNFSPPIALLDGQLNTQEGVATIANENGNLLFYTDGSTVWDENHDAVPNGNGDLDGHFSATQSAIITPHPGNSNQFFIFTTDELGGPNGLSFSIYDVSLEGNGDENFPLGDIDASKKNIRLNVPVTEKLTAILKSNAGEYWILAHAWNSDDFYAYELTCDGLNETPIISSIGNVHSGGIDNINSVGYIKASPDGSKIGLVNRTTNTIELFDFDKASGKLSNFKEYSPIVSSLYGIEFSVDSKYVFVGDLNNILRYEIETDDLTYIEADNNSPFSSSNVIRAIQIGPDLNIYVSIRNWEYISVIEDPTGFSPIIKTSDILLNPDGLNRKCKFGLPNIFLFNTNPIDTFLLSACQGDSVVFENESYIAGSVNVINKSDDNGCIFSSLLIVEEDDSILVERTESVCPGVDFSYQGLSVPAGAMESFLISNPEGCDTLLTISVEEYIIPTEILQFETCKNTSVIYNGEFIPANSQQIFTLISANGCDSTVIVNVNEVDVINEVISVEICNQTTYNYEGIDYQIGTDTILIFIDSSGCDKEVQLEVMESPIVEFSLDTENSCENENNGSVEISGLIGQGLLYKYSVDGINFIASSRFDSLSSGNYTYFIQDDNNCIYSQDFQIDYLPDFELEANDAIIPCGSDSINIQINPSNLDQNEIDWVWENGNTTNNMITFSEPGTYNFIASNRCHTVNESIIVKFEDFDAKNYVYVPNAFSPNNDGINDIFKPYINPEMQIIEYTFHIYDRWGNEVFTTQDITHGWNGKFRNKIGESGVYVWKLNLNGTVCNRIQIIKEKGNFTIVSRQ